MAESLYKFGKNRTDPESYHKADTQQTKTSPDREINLEAIQEMTDTFGPDAVKDLAYKMMSQYDEHRQRITEYMQKEKWHEIGREAHMLKSCFAQFGLQNASVEAAKIDVFCKQNDLDKIMETTPAMLDRCDDAIAELKSQFINL